MLACYEVLIAEIFWFGQQTAYDFSLVVYGLAEMQMTIPLKRWQVRQDSKNDFCGFRCVIRPIQKMFELKSYFY
jgi:hypothetical protein